MLLNLCQIYVSHVYPTIIYDILKIARSRNSTSATIISRRAYCISFARVEPKIAVAIGVSRQMQTTTALER